MKKIILSAAMGSLFFAAVVADQAVVTAHEEQPAITDDGCEAAGDQKSFGGLDFILGVGGNFFKMKNSNGTIKNKNMNRFLGTIGFGAGKVFNDKFYVGGEFLTDFSKAKTQKFYANKALTAADLGAKDHGAPGADAGSDLGDAFKLYGIVPSLGLRFGCIMPNGTTMVYAKVSAVFQRIALQSYVDAKAIVPNVTACAKKNKVSVAFSLGAEHKLTRKISLRAEGEYMLTAKAPKLYDEGTAAYPTEKVKFGGFKVRALFVYNVNL